MATVKQIEIAAKEEPTTEYIRVRGARVHNPKNIDCEIPGIAPAVAIQQRNPTRWRPSTVATAPEIYDYLRLLFARAGQTFCAQCGVEVKKDSVDEVADRLRRLPAG